MSNQEILEKALQKAIDGGFGINAWKNWEKAWLQTDDYGYEIRISKGKNEKSIGWFPSEYDIIFNHDFAKALWGEELHQETFIVPKELNKRFAGTKDLDIKPTWMYHLQQMVIAEDPVQYLGENL